MIERVIEFSIHNRWLVIAAGLLLALGGVYAVYHTPVDAIPDLSENQVIVFAGCNFGLVNAQPATHPKMDTQPTSTRKTKEHLLPVPF